MGHILSPLHCPPLPSPPVRRFAARGGCGRLLLLLLLNIVLLGLLGLFTWFDNAANRGITYRPDPTRKPVPWSAGPQVGVNVYNLHMEPDPAAVTRTLRLAHAMGARYVRMQMPWEDVEIHGWSDFTDRRNLETTGAISAWAKYDRIVNLANALGLELVIRLDRPPDWARQRARIQPAFKAGLERDSNSTGPPDNYADYSAFVSTVVSRYRGKVRFFQLWNEPNLKNEWNWQEPDPEAFTRLLQFGSTAARAANPDVVILFPPLAPVDGLDWRAPMTELEYLDRVYRAGGKDHFDIMSVQGYGLGQPPDEHRYIRLRPLNNWSWRRPVDTRADVSRLVLLREVMERHGDGDKAIWMSEFGWNSAPASIPAERRFTWGEPVNEQQKARYLVGQIERARNEWPWVGVMFVWVLRYGGYQAPDPADPTPYFALVSRDWEKLPAYQRLQDYLAQPVAAGVGVHPWDHPAVETVEGGWRLRFSGARVTLVGELEGELEEVTLDGHPTAPEREELSTGEQAYTVSSHAFPFTTTPSTHTLEIAAPGGEPPSRFVVSRNPPLPWFWSLAPAVLIGMLVLGSAGVVRVLYDLLTPS